MHEESMKLHDDVVIYLGGITQHPFQNNDSLVRIQANPYPLRGILAEQVGMNSEVKRPQRGGYLAGAQGPHRVPPAKAVRKSCQFPRERQTPGRVNLNFLGYHLPSVVQYIVHSLALSFVAAAVPAVVLLSVCPALMLRGRSRSGREVRHVTHPLSLPFFTLARDAPFPLSHPPRPFSPRGRTSLCSGDSSSRTAKSFDANNAAGRTDPVARSTKRHALIRTATSAMPQRRPPIIYKTMRAARRPRW